MEFEAISHRALEVRKQFAAFERATYGEEWSRSDLVMGLMKDVGDLAEVVQRLEGKRPARASDAMADLRHEICDCIWSLLVLAQSYDLDVPVAFGETMDGIEEWIENQAIKP